MFERIQAIIADKLSIDEGSVTMEASFIDDLNADSLDIVELIMALEDELDMEIQMKTLKTLRQLEMLSITLKLITKE